MFLQQKRLWHQKCTIVETIDCTKCHACHQKVDPSEPPQTPKLLKNTVFLYLCTCTFIFFALSKSPNLGFLLLFYIVLAPSGCPIWNQLGTNLSPSLSQLRPTWGRCALGLVPWSVSHNQLTNKWTDEHMTVQLCNCATVRPCATVRLCVSRTHDLLQDCVYLPGPAECAKCLE